VGIPPEPPFFFFTYRRGSISFRMCNRSLPIAEALRP
jgi:hypothetical protein